MGYANKLGSYVLHILTTSAASNTKHEFTQVCFTVLTSLVTLNFKVSSHNIELESSNEKNLVWKFTNSQMNVLISILHSSVSNSQHFNATFKLIKTITTIKYISSEYYDLMELMLKLSVQSQTNSIRKQSCQIFQKYIIGYPMGK